MGTTKQITGDGHLIFHVGKELPEENSNFVLVPGKQDAQGRGVYFSDDPRLKYSGGEQDKKELAITPIFAIPILGEWNKSKNKKKDEITYNSAEQLIFLYDLIIKEDHINGHPVRYYLPKEAKLVKEIEVFKNGRHTWSPFAERIKNGILTFEDALSELKRSDNYRETNIGREIITRAYEDAYRAERIPYMNLENNETEYRSELRSKIKKF